MDPLAVRSPNESLTILLTSLLIVVASLVIQRNALSAAQRPPSLSVRNAHSMVFDPRRDSVVLFGGADASKVCGDTWEWIAAAKTWRHIADRGPAPRTFAAFAFDEARGEAILFGGNRVLFGKDDERDTFLNDTWRFRGGVWERRDTVGPRPAARAEAAAAYDRDRKRIVLFGGYRRTAEGTVRLGDTWEWDGVRWIQAAVDGPTPRNGAAMVYDERRRRAVLFGGPGPSSETWEWDGHGWKEYQDQPVPGRFNPAMIYDAARGLIVRFGGWNGSNRLDDTWTRGDGPWLQREVSGPPARNHAAFAYDRTRARGVLFGGHDGDNVFGDTWEWNGSGWARAAFTPPQKRVDNGH